MRTDCRHVDGIKDNAALALMELARPPEHELRAHHFNAAGYIRQATNLAGVADHRLRAMTGPDVWIALFPHDQEAGPRGLPTPQGMETASA